MRRTLFAVALALASANASAVKDYATNADGSLVETITYEDNNSIWTQVTTTSPDGTIVSNFTDSYGNINTLTNYPDGTQVKQTPAGTETKTGNGSGLPTSETFVDVLGRSSYMYITENEDGSQTWSYSHPDGAVFSFTTLPAGTTSRTNEDGSTTVPGDGSNETYQRTTTTWANGCTDYVTFESLAPGQEGTTADFKPTLEGEVYNTTGLSVTSKCPNGTYIERQYSGAALSFLYTSTSDVNGSKIETILKQDGLEEIQFSKADGSHKGTQKNAEGRVTYTESKSADGSITKTNFSADGSSVAVTTYVDESTLTTTINADGLVSTNQTAWYSDKETSGWTSIYTATNGTTTFTNVDGCQTITNPDGTYVVLATEQEQEQEQSYAGLIIGIVGLVAAGAGGFYCYKKHHHHHHHDDHYR